MKEKQKPELSRSGLSGSPDVDEGAAGARGGHGGWGGWGRFDRGPNEAPETRSRWRRFVDSTRGTLASLPRVLRLVWDASPALTIGIFAVTLVAGLLPAATAYMSKLLINAVVQGIVIHTQHLPDRTILDVPLPLWTYRSPELTATGAIIALAIAQLVIFSVSALMATGRNIAQQLLQERVQMRIQLLVMEHAARLDLPFFEDSASYDLLRRAQNDSANRPVAMVSGLFGLLQTIVTFTSMVALLIAVSPWLALLALLSPIPAFISDTRYGWRGFTIARWSSPLLRRMTYLVTLVTTDTYAKEVKLFDLGDYFVERYRRLSQTYFDRQRGLVFRRYLAGFAWGTLTTIAGSLTYLYVALQAIAGRLTLGDLTLYTAAASAVQGSIQGILGGFSSMYEHNLYLSVLFQLLETEGSIESPANPIPLPVPFRGEVEFQNVTFSYPGVSEPALKNLSFRIAAGETIAIVGRNGAGKTTLIKLLCRLYDPQAGRIVIDGHDIREYDLGQLRSQVSAVFQDYVTYQATAAENIGLGSLERIEDRAAIEEAGERSGAGELIRRLPDRYDTALGKWFDKGVNLSGGEWQKVALARGFVRDRATILVLDEPTSALDAQAEYELFDRLHRLASGRTAVYISHRFSTVRRADRILFIEHGALVEEGTHAQLMALEGRYARLFKMQASAYTGEEVEALVE